MPEKPNILIIIADQLSAQALPAYGDTYARTPHIDRIVRSGVRFETCYTNCPLCQPARAAFWTGLFPHQTGVLSNGRRHPVPPVPERIPTLGELFARAGYGTVHLGKTHDAGSLRGFYVEPRGNLPVQAEGHYRKYNGPRDRPYPQARRSRSRGPSERPPQNGSMYLAPAERPSSPAAMEHSGIAVRCSALLARPDYFRIFARKDAILNP